MSSLHNVNESNAPTSGSTHETNINDTESNGQDGRNVFSSDSTDQGRTGPGISSTQSDRRGGRGRNTHRNNPRNDFVCNMPGFGTTFFRGATNVTINHTSNGPWFTQVNGNATMFSSNDPAHTNINFWEDSDSSEDEVSDGDEHERSGGNPGNTTRSSSSQSIPLQSAGFFNGASGFVISGGNFSVVNGNVVHRTRTVPSSAPRNGQPRPSPGASANTTGSSATSQSPPPVRGPARRGDAHFNDASGFVITLGVDGTNQISWPNGTPE